MKIQAIETDKSKFEQIFLKFEPFILHVCCRNLTFAKMMVNKFQILKHFHNFNKLYFLKLEQCIASGYRNSGISLGSSKAILVNISYILLSN